MAGRRAGPSAFWSGPPLFAIGDGARVANTLLYAAQPNGQPSGQPSGPGDILAGVAGSDTLAALLGPTRAAVLRVLRQPRGTVDLAAAVGISPASASEHAKVLREASRWAIGLVASVEGPAGMAAMMR